MSVAVMTDTNSNISVEEGKRLGITVIPMPMTVNGKSYLEGVDITHEELYRAMRDKKEVSTSMPSPQVLTEEWKRLLKDYDEVVYLPMSSGLSNSCETAKSFAAQIKGVHVVDNHRISFSLRESVLDAKFLADGGADGAEIKRKLEETAYDASIYITVNSLYYLKKSGRVTASASLIATALNIKPVLTIQGGKLDAYAKVRGMKKSKLVMIEALRKDVEKRFSSVPEERLRFAAGGTLETEEEQNEWLAQVSQAFPKAQVYYVPMPCNIVAHLGIGSVGTGVSVALER